MELLSTDFGSSSEGKTSLDSAMEQITDHVMRHKILMTIHFNHLDFATETSHIS